jgi:hypothetical protein
LGRLKEIESIPGEARASVDSNEEKDDCAFCDLFMAEAEEGKVVKKDAELFSLHLSASTHPGASRT